MSKSAIFLLIIGFLATSIFVCVESAHQRINSGPIITPNLVSLGTVDGKTFFYDNTPRSWAASKTYCESLGMKLGKIATVAQQNFLLGKYKTGLFDGYHWTAGRDARSLEQFVWDTDQTSLLKFGAYSSYSNQLTCVNYFATSYSSTNGRWTSASCNTGYKVICETF